MESGSYTKAQPEAYDRYWDGIRKERSYYLDAEEKGLKAGMEKGIKAGMEKA